MTGPIIPAELWPEWADRHCWDKRGIGQFIGIQTDKYSWRKWAANSGIPLPAGHDWRVPVMRQPSPTIDLERYAVAIQYAINGMREAGGITNAKVASKLAGLLALIDGQADPAKMNEQFGISEGLPAIGLELVREAVEVAIAHAGPNDGSLAGWQRLLALIDGQARSSHAPDAWTDEQCAEFLSVAMRHVQIKGVLIMNEIRQGQMRANALQPTKGEGE